MPFLASGSLEPLSKQPDHPAGKARGEAQGLRGGQGSLVRHQVEEPSPTLSPAQLTVTADSMSHGAGPCLNAGFTKQ